MEDFTSYEAFILLKAMEELHAGSLRQAQDPRLGAQMLIGDNLKWEEQIIQKLNRLQRKHGGDPNRIVLREV